MGQKILIIGTTDKIAKALENEFEDEAVEICYESSIEAGYNSLIYKNYSLVIFELHPNEYSGIKALEWLHQQSSVPIVVFSSSPSKTEEIEALTMGAEQYWVAPFDMDIFPLRIKALIRRFDLSSRDWDLFYDIITFNNGLKINSRAQSAYLNGKQLKLHPKQFAILACLGRQIGQAVTKE